MLSTRYDLRNFPRSLRVCYGFALYDYKLSLTAALPLTPPPPASLRCRPAPVPLSTRNHILLFRVVNAGALRVALHSPLSHTDSHVPPPIEEAAAFIPSPRHGNSHLSSATPRYAYDTPKGREDRAPPADVKANVIDPTRNVEIAVLTNTPSVSPLRHQSSPTPSIFVHGYASLRCE